MRNLSEASISVALRLRAKAANKKLTHWL